MFLLDYRDVFLDKYVCVHIFGVKAYSCNKCFVLVLKDIIHLSMMVCVILINILFQIYFIYTFYGCISLA